MARNCFAPGCDTGYPSSLKRNKALGKKNPSLFSAPKDVKVLEKWQRAIPRKDKVFMRPYKLCELHFDDECISRTIEVKLTDGTLYVQERERPILKDVTNLTVSHLMAVKEKYCHQQLGILPLPLDPAIEFLNMKVL